MLVLLQLVLVLLRLIVMILMDAYGSNTLSTSVVTIDDVIIAQILLDIFSAAIIIVVYFPGFFYEKV